MTEATRVLFDGLIEPDWFLSCVWCFDLAGERLRLDPVVGVPIGRFEVHGTNGAFVIHRP